jgi:hypothetical protein
VRPPARRPPPVEESEYEEVEYEEVESEPEVWSGPVHDPRARRNVLEELLRAGMRDGSSTVPSIPPEIGIKVVSALGCLRRLAMIVFILVMLALAFSFGLFGFSPPPTIPASVPEGVAAVRTRVLE